MSALLDMKIWETKVLCCKVIWPDPLNDLDANRKIQALEL